MHFRMKKHHNAAHSLHLFSQGLVQVYITLSQFYPQIHPLPTTVITLTCLLFIYLFRPSECGADQSNLTDFSVAVRLWMSSTSQNSLLTRTHD